MNEVAVFGIYKYKKHLSHVNHYFWADMHLEICFFSFMILDIFAGQAPNKVWVDEQIETPRQAFLEGLTTGLKAPSGKGRRLIISHIGSEEGFVDGGLLMFESKKNTADNEEMNAEHFEEWLEGIIPRFKKTNSVLVLDNAP